MILSNELDDIFYCFVLIRDDIEAECNSMVLECIINALSEKPEDNSIRKRISVIKAMDSVKWNFVFHYNLYTYRELIKHEPTQKKLISLCIFLKALLDCKKYDEAYDFVDAIHFLPLLIKEKKLLTNFKIKQVTKYYRKKWNVGFWSLVPKAF